MVDVRILLHATVERLDASQEWRQSNLAFPRGNVW